MTEVALIIFAALIIYFVATKVAPQNLMFKLKKEEKKIEQKKVFSQEAEKGSKGKVLIHEGQKLLNAGDLEGAEKKLLEAVKLDTSAAEAYHFLGMIYLRQKIYKGAIAALERAVELDPLNDTAFNNLGLSYLSIDKYDDAIKNLEKSISLNDKIAHRYSNLALAYQKTKNLEKAAISLEGAAKIHPNPENLTLLAKNYLSLNDKKLGLKTIEKLVELDPGNVWAKRQLAALKD